MPWYRFVSVACWAIFGLVWVVAALFTKRTVERRSHFWLVMVVALVEAAIIIPVAARAPALRAVIVPQTGALGALSAAISVAGLVFTLWARYTLGRNWSGTITFKEDHELVQRGPYALARHPIYTGVLIMLLGLVLTIGTVEALAFVPFICLVLWLKARQEERLLMKHFPDAYASYKARVRALLPIPR